MTRVTSLLAAAAFAAFASGPPARAQTGSGELRCNVQGGFGVIIAANRAITCVYRRHNLPTEFYTGFTGNIGLDVGPTNAVVLTYRVTSADLAAPGALDGDFAGPGFGVIGGAGLSANALVGGQSSTVFLLPIPNTATTAFTGLNISVGINRLHLQYAAVEPGRGRAHKSPYSDENLR